MITGFGDGRLATQKHLNAEHEDLTNSLFKLFCLEWSVGIPIEGPVIKAEANEFVICMNTETFTALRGSCTSSKEERTEVSWVVLTLGHLQHRWMWTLLWPPSWWNTNQKYGLCMGRKRSAVCTCRQFGQHETYWINCCNLFVLMEIKSFPIYMGQMKKHGWCQNCPSRN